MKTLPAFLNEKNVSLLENHWSELPQEARCEMSTQGWKIHFLGSGRLFVQAGFRENEVVSPEALLHHTKTAGEKNLVERVLAILDHIRVDGSTT